MRFILAFTFCFLCISVSAQKKKYSVVGNLNNDFSGTIYVVVDKEKFELQAEDRKFTLKGKLDRPTLALISTANRSCQTAFYLDTADVTLDIEVVSKLPIPVPCLQIKKVNGSNAHEFYTRFQKDLQASMRGARILNDELSNKLTAVFTKYMNEDPDFAYEQSLYQSSMLMNAADIETVYNRLSKRSKDAVYGQASFKKLQQRKLTATGSEIPSFEQKDVKGKKISIKDFAGKPVLIDFWASWCGPCRAENPNLVRAYERFHEKGLEILGVSLDDSKEAWVEAIEKDGLIWRHVSDLRGWENSVAKQFYVSAIPFNILLNAEGKVVGTNLTGNALHAKLAELFKSK